MAATSKQQMTAAGPSLEITRFFEAPRELVWKAWTEPERVVRWLGPRGFEALEFTTDNRPGGAWHSRMRSPDGVDYANGGRLLEVIQPERLAMTFAWDDEDGKPGREMLITIVFVERDGGTEMTFTQAVFESDEDRDGHNQGWSESFDRLGEYLVNVKVA
jgi:uncharacterized protein YndB with AHSA1/START domain